MANEEYEVLSPLGRRVADEVHVGRRVTDLNGKTIGELGTGDYGFFPVIREELRRRYPDVRFVTREKFGDVHGPDEREVIQALPENLHTYRVDAVVSGIGL